MIQVSSNKLRKERLFSFWFNTAFVEPFDESSKLQIETNCSSTSTLNSSLDNNYENNRHRHNSMINTTVHQSTELTNTFNSLNMHHPNKNNLINSFKHVSGEEGNSANSSISSNCSNTSLNSSNFSYSQPGLNTLSTVLQQNNEISLTPNSKLTTAITNTQSDQNESEMIRHQLNNIVNSSLDLSTSSSHNTCIPILIKNGNHHKSSKNDLKDDFKLSNHKINSSLFKKQSGHAKISSPFNGHSKTSSQTSSSLYSGVTVSSSNNSIISNQNRSINSNSITNDSSASCSSTTVSSSRLNTSLSNNNNASRQRFNSGPAFETSTTNEKR